MCRKVLGTTTAERKPPSHQGPDKYCQRAQADLVVFSGAAISPFELNLIKHQFEMLGANGHLRERHSRTQK